MNYIKQIDCITRGLPKIVILGGFQQDGHDHQYPWWTPINDSFTAPGGLTGKEADARQLALGFYGPIFLMYSLYDAADEKEEIITMLELHVEHFTKML